MDAANEIVTESYKRVRMKDRWLVYQMPQGDWGASGGGFISDGFATELEAEEWAIKQYEATLTHQCLKCEDAIDIFEFEEGNGLCGKCWSYKGD